MMSQHATINFFIVIFLSLRCHQFAESLAAPCNTVTPSNRVFVAGISHTCTEQTIRSTFSHFGGVENILIIGQDDATKKRNRLPYCFVTFDDVSSAQRAVTAPNPTSDVYKEMQYAMPQDDSRRRSNQSRLEEMKRVTQIEEFGKETNLIVQVQSTHLDRLVEYLHRWNNSQNTDTDDTSNSCRVLGSTKANSKNVSVLFLSCDNPTSLARKLYMDPLLARAINKSYIVQSGVLLEGNLATEQGCNEFAKILFDNVSQTHQEEMILRMSVFPPKQQSRLLQSFDTIVNDDSINASRQLTIAPKGFSHMLSVVEVYQDKGRGWERRQQDSNNKLYMVGVSPASLELDVVDTNNIMADDGSDNVNRAYYKLKEAIEMYEASSSHGKLHQDFYDGSIALDCGSSPGGWTKYLIEHFGCQKVYSIDPGELAPSVLELKETSHMQMKIQDALPLLLEDEAAKGQVKIWVSDMCLHNMEDQANLLLLAKEKGLLAKKTFFVLTLKCVVGRSKLSYDSQVETVVDAFCASASIDSLEIFHLFSNRSGERTVIGCIN